MPSAWKPVRIQPIYKKGNPLDPNNYRPIAITSVLYRMYASVLTTVTDIWARENKHVREEQFGFQRRRSTNQAAFVLRHLANSQRAVGRKGRLHCCFVDFEKAYDSINHRLLWDHLSSKLQMPAGLLQAVQALYEGAVYVLQDGHKCTSPVPAGRGIKQGCPLSPLLFSLFINDMPAFLQQQCPEAGIMCGERRIRCVKFADDLSLPSSSSSGLQQLLDALHKYATEKQITVNVKKTEVLEFGGKLASKRTAGSNGITYGPARQPLRVVSGFKFLGLQLHEGGNMQHTMEGREAPFTAALQRTRRIASRVRLGRHVPTRIRLAAVYAAPTANYGDVIWSTAALKPQHALDNPLQRQLLSHMQAVAGVPASTPRWPLLSELGLQPMQRAWWSHVVRFYNTAISAEGRAASPLMAAAMQADVALAKRQMGVKQPGTWSGQLLEAIEAVEAAAAGGGEQMEPQPPSLRTAVEELRTLPEASVMRLLDMAYQQQWGGGSKRGDPRDPATKHRPEAAYNKWFRSTAGTVLAHAALRTRSKQCAEVRANLRLRLGAVATAVTKGQQTNGRVPFERRLCVACTVTGAGSHIEDAQHACFECTHMLGRLAGKGWDSPPGGAGDFEQLYAKGNVKGGMQYAGQIVEWVEGR